MSEQLKGLITGLTDSPPQEVTSLLVNGKKYKVAELLAALTAYADKYEATDEAFTAFRTALEERVAIEPEAVHLVQGVRTVLKGMYGKKSVALETYGITPDKEPVPLTPEQEVVKVAKAKATRIARHTLGKKQKEKIKGQWPPAEGEGQPPGASS
jgi:hypothetical protein